MTAWLWTRAVRRVNAAHPGQPGAARVRSVFFLGGLLAIAIALQSGIERYDTTLFSVHMVQHMLLTLVAAPLIALGAPITLLLRVATPAVRRRWILPVLHSRLLRVVSFPVVAWSLFAAVMWGTHFSPLFDVALEDRTVHDLEHLLYLAAALLFWWPAVGLDPRPWRLNHPVRVLYVFLQMPQNTLLAVIILNAAAPLYRPLRHPRRSRGGRSTLLDQQTAAGIMWLAGDLLFIGAMAGSWPAGCVTRSARRHARSGSPTRSWPRSGFARRISQSDWPTRATGAEADRRRAGERSPLRFLARGAACFIVSLEDDRIRFRN